MNVLITGAAGFIGSHLAKRLLEEGDRVVGLDAFDETLYDAATHEANAAAVPGLELVRGDILDAARVAELVKGRDLVVHLAALAGVRPSIEQPARYCRVNVEGTGVILEACRRAGVSKVVFASSSSVYGVRNQVPFVEDDPCLQPASPYAATKRAGELLCSTFVDLYGMGIASLRFFTVYGPRQRPEMAIHKFARQIRAGQPVTLFGDGSSARDYTYVDDVIDGTVAACRRVREGTHRIYNLGGSRATTLHRLVELLSEGLGKAPVIDWQPNQPGDVPITFADVSRAQAELGYAPRVTMEEGIRRFVQWLGP